ncbi:MAG: hypothetical protein ACJZ4Z_01690 [Candidatus Thalassarchaeaceae archaeon]
MKIHQKKDQSWTLNLRILGHITLAKPVKPIETVRLKLPLNEISILPVPPISIRAKYPNDLLGGVLNDICNLNRNIKNLTEIFEEKSTLEKLENEGEDIIESLHDLITYHLSTYLDNQLGEYWASKRGIYTPFVNGIYQICYPHDKSRTYTKSDPIEKRTKRTQNFESHFS